MLDLFLVLAHYVAEDVSDNSKPLRKLAKKSLTTSFAKNHVDVSSPVKCLDDSMIEFFNSSGECFPLGDEENSVDCFGESDRLKVLGSLLNNPIADDTTASPTLSFRSRKRESPAVADVSDAKRLKTNSVVPEDAIGSALVPCVHVSRNEKKASAGILISPERPRSPIAFVPTKPAPKSPMKIGDQTRLYTLPLIMGRNPALACVTAETLSRVLKGEIAEMATPTIVDCRFPYEYEGGHIRGARNIWTQEDCYDFLFATKSELRFGLSPSSKNRRILVFHCEFSRHRGPKMYNFVREVDRKINEYPQLVYPEIYLLHAGYREFFRQFPDLCEPRTYIEMDDDNFKADLRRCKARSKTADNMLKNLSRRTLAVRSSTCRL